MRTEEGNKRMHQEDNDAPGEEGKKKNEIKKLHAISP